MAIKHLKKSAKKSAKSLAKPSAKKPTKQLAQKHQLTASNPAWEVIYAAIERIPSGSVSTYGAIAQLAGLPRRARLVGTALRSMPSARSLPWHRVITSSGKFAFPENSDAYAKQRARLAREGVRLIRNRIDLNRYGWPREDKTLDELLWGSAE